MGMAIENGAVVVSDEDYSGNTIVAVGNAEQLRIQFPHANPKEVGIIAPAPVNAHTHLDMSLYPFVALPYERWIPEIAIGNRHLRGKEGSKKGAAELVQLGQPVGDIVWSEEGMEELLGTEGLEGTLYWEILGTFPEKADDIWAKARQKIERWRRICPPQLRIGLSPHTPYTVSHRLLKLVSEYAREEGLPLQIHVAESRGELELFKTGGGSLWEHRFAPLFPDTFAEVIGRSPHAELSPVNYLEELGVLDATLTLVHAVHTSAADRAAVARAGCTVVTCPRSNANLECGTFPWKEWAAAGVNIAIGTDSVASGETLDIRDEVAFAAQLYPELDLRHVVRAAVKGGRRVVGGSVPFLRRGERWHDSYIWSR